MAKAEISWKRILPEGEKLQVYARRVGGHWRFHSRLRRFDPWEYQANPPLEDWLELLDAVKRRVPRRLLPPDEIDRVCQAIRERFPDAPL
jgi:hypothetical protein